MFADFAAETETAIAVGRKTGGFYSYENDISAEKEIQSTCTRLSCKNENSRRSQGIVSQKSKRQEIPDSLGHSFVAFLSLMKFSESLKKNQDFRAVYKNGRSRADHAMVMYCMENGTQRNRIGISASKKVGNSVVRHRFARLVRESYRLHEQEFRPGYDIVVVARRAAAESTYFDIEKALLHLAEIHKVLMEKKPGPAGQNSVCEEPGA